jgi:hypothetical protein
VYNPFPKVDCRASGKGDEEERQQAMSGIIGEFPEDAHGRAPRDVLKSAQRILTAFGQTEHNSVRRVYNEGDFSFVLHEDTGALDVTYKGVTELSCGPDGNIMCEADEGSERAGWIDKMRQIEQRIPADKFLF